ncbi:hypothetical protein NC653_003160 [Populus alba x Populus x berolinensis]|uniref:Uncharacterized protein n=1 Tax=Populus alba x Populus x berolinensis TaxID=444605 RepID=A0AAD6RRX3_9ROSI|nr:hypothetical protein NC653_003160 [Populus alba x Populus x berolinensis]
MSSSHSSSHDIEAPNCERLFLIIRVELKRNCKRLLKSSSLEHFARTGYVNFPKTEDGMTARIPMKELKRQGISREEIQTDNKDSRDYSQIDPALKSTVTTVSRPTEHGTPISYLTFQDRHNRIPQSMTGSIHLHLLKHSIASQKQVLSSFERLG